MRCFVISVIVHGLVLGVAGMLFARHHPPEAAIAAVPEPVVSINFRESDHTMDVIESAASLHDPRVLEPLPEAVEPAVPEFKEPAAAPAEPSDPKFDEAVTPPAGLDVVKPVVDSDTRLAFSEEASSMTEGPEPAVNPKPAYPRLARRLGYEGRVVLSVRVSVDGKPVAVSVAATSGYAMLDEAAVEAVGRWIFKPARRKGVPVESSADIAIRFVLEETR